MSLMFRSAAILAALALAGCNKQEAASDKAAAGAQLQQRSVTDDMPAYDTVRSQSPHMAPEAGGSSARRPTSDASASTGDSTADAAAAAAADVEAAAVDSTAPVKPGGE